jgi:hypothetical protein
VERKTGLSMGAGRVMREFARTSNGADRPVFAVANPGPRTATFEMQLTVISIYKPKRELMQASLLSCMLGVFVSEAVSA